MFNTPTFNTPSTPRGNRIVKKRPLSDPGRGCQKSPWWNTKRGARACALASASVPPPLKLLTFLPAIALQRYLSPLGTGLRRPTATSTLKPAIIRRIPERHLNHTKKPRLYAQRPAISAQPVQDTSKFLDWKQGQELRF